MNALVDLGIITSTKGLKGEVKVKALGDSKLLLSLQKFFLSPPTPSIKTLTIESVSKGNKLMIVKFKEINSIEEASELKGKFLQQTADQLPENYFSLSSLIGLEVFSNNGIFLGTVTQLEESKAHDILVVGNKIEYRVPLIKEVIKDINIAKGSIFLRISKDQL